MATSCGFDEHDFAEIMAPFQNVDAAAAAVSSRLICHRSPISNSRDFAR
jgi:hypothetical protein